MILIKSWLSRHLQSSAGLYLSMRLMQYLQWPAPILRQKSSNNIRGGLKAVSQKMRGFKAQP